MCKFYYEPKDECLKMTRILQDAGVIGFHAMMGDQKRSCCGLEIGCFFSKTAITEIIKNSPFPVFVILRTDQHKMTHKHCGGEIVEDTGKLYALCPDCGGSNYQIINLSGEAVCQDCKGRIEFHPKQVCSLCGKEILGDKDIDLPEETNHVS